MAKIEMELDIPNLPNFLKVLNTDGGCVDVADVPEEALRALGEEWTESLVLHAAERREDRKAGIA